MIEVISQPEAVLVEVISQSEAFLVEETSQPEAVLIEETSLNPRLPWLRKTVSTRGCPG